ncbi:MAG: LLM class flavin-dependent oxidoreductase [Actinomycetota bacterium]|nr:LLM class flavin-dependent oxidoreductase [Actinomycetota bacterium]
MIFDLFCSLAQTPRPNGMPPESLILAEFFEQVTLADQLGFDTVWVAETHYSSDAQQRHANPVIPSWRGEIGVNNDTCQLAARIFEQTTTLSVGSAIMNVVCNGGPLAAAERVATAVALHGLDPMEQRKINIGFAGGRFDFVNATSGIRPRAEWERRAWPQVKRVIFWEAAETFVRLLSGEGLTSSDVGPLSLGAGDFSDHETWRDIARLAGVRGDQIVVPRRWEYEYTKIVPSDYRRELLTLTAGTHDPELQKHLNTFAPVRAFNLSITQSSVIEATHDRMRRYFHPAGGPWCRDYMPRTVFVFVNGNPRLAEQAQREAAKSRAREALSAYWTAMEGTVDASRLAKSESNALVGNPDDVASQINDRYHPEDRLMLWFDFFANDNATVLQAMEDFWTYVVPRFK